MFKHLCTKCGKNSYSSDEICFSVCPYCGCRFSGKYGPDKRREERLKKETDIAIIYQGRLLEAVTTDFSEDGLGIKIFGEIPFTAGETIELSTSGIQIKTKVMWIRQFDDESLAGRQKLS